ATPRRRHQPFDRGRSVEPQPAHRFSPRPGRPRAVALSRRSHRPAAPRADARGRRAGGLAAAADARRDGVNAISWASLASKAAWRGVAIHPTVDRKLRDSGMKLPRNFFKALAIGAPAPLRELPLKLERMIHFVPPHIEKVRARVPELVHQVDVVLGNL